MQCIVSVIFRQRVFHAVDREFAVRNAISITSDGGAEVRFSAGISADIVVAVRDVDEISLTIWNLDAHHSAAKIRDRHLHAVLVRQRVETGGSTVRGFSKFLLGHFRISCSAGGVCCRRYSYRSQQSRRGEHRYRCQYRGYRQTRRQSSV